MSHAGPNIAGGGRRSVPIAAPTVDIVPYGGPTFDLEDGMIVPYIQPSQMNLTSPLAGTRDLFTYANDT
jgi:hypothetical protein